MPNKPFDGQKRPPCHGGQVELSGGCWYRVAPDPAGLAPGATCTADLYERDKQCYLPVRALANSIRESP
jgi:hypothetical protein